MIKSSSLTDVSNELGVVGVYYHSNNLAIKSIFKKYKENFIFSTKIDQYSILLCDFLICEEKLLNPTWFNHCPSISIERWKDSNFSINSLEKIKRDFYKDETYLPIEFNFLSSLKQCPVNIFSRIEQSGNVHFSLKKEKGIYLTNIPIGHLFYNGRDLGILLRKVKNVFLELVDLKDTKKCFEIILFTLHHLRINFNSTNNIFNIFGILNAFSEMLNEIFSDDLIQILFELKDQFGKDYYLELEMLYASCLVVKNKKKKQLILAIFSQHLLFSKTELGLISDELSFSRHVFSSGYEKTTVMDHAFILSKIFKDLKIFDDDVARLLKHHHGSITGKGFSSAIRSSLTDDDLDLIALNLGSQAFMELRPGENIDYLLNIKKKNIALERLKSRIGKIDFLT